MNIYGLLPTRFAVGYMWEINSKGVPEGQLMPSLPLVLLASEMTIWHVCLIAAQNKEVLNAGSKGEGSGLHITGGGAGAHLKAVFRIRRGR